MNANAELQHLRRVVTDSKVLDALKEVERHGRDLAGVCVVVAYRQSADDHIGVSDRLDLVDVVAFDDRVEERVEVVEHVDDLRR